MTTILEDPITFVKIPKNRLYVVTEGKHIYNFHIATLVMLIKDKLYETDNPFTRQVFKKAIIDDVIDTYNNFAHVKMPSMLEIYAHDIWWNLCEQELYCSITYYIIVVEYLSVVDNIYRHPKVVTWVFRKIEDMRIRE